MMIPSLWPRAFEADDSDFGKGEPAEMKKRQQAQAGPGHSHGAGQGGPRFGQTQSSGNQDFHRNRE
jgi:hypothetical protein